MFSGRIKAVGRLSATKEIYIIMDCKIKGYAIKAENIEKKFNDERVLKGITLDVLPGEFVSIMGESGSGKSTLLSIIGGFLAADGGRVLWNGRDISELSERELARARCTDVGFVFQSYKLIPTLNVKDNLLLPTTLGGKLSPEGVEYAMELCRELGIDGMLSKYPSELSGGQCQRVAIIRALAYKPSLLILDEPTGALDSAMEKRVMELISRINEESGTTVVQVTHSERVARYGGRIINLSDGVIGL